MTPGYAGDGRSDHGAVGEAEEPKSPGRQQPAHDASALDAAFLGSQAAADRVNTQRVITPHPGEAAKLLTQTTAQVQGDRLQATTNLVDAFTAITVLKGSGTLVAEPGKTPFAINTRGNPGMASAGMGDVLSGIIGALLGQGLDAFAAARSGVYIHALCAESWSRGRDSSGLIAGDIIDQIPRIVKKLRDAG